MCILRERVYGAFRVSLQFFQVLDDKRWNNRVEALDITTERGLEILWELIRLSDVLIQNFRPGVAARLGFSWPRAQELNPQLVYLSISGFGPEGPYAHKRVYDNIIQAYSGISAVQDDPETGDPGIVRQLLCDKLTSYTASQAVTAAC